MSKRQDRQRHRWLAHMYFNGGRDEKKSNSAHFEQFENLWPLTYVLKSVFYGVVHIVINGLCHVRRHRRFDVVIIVVIVILGSGCVMHCRSKSFLYAMPLKSLLILQR